MNFDFMSGIGAIGSGLLGYVVPFLFVLTVVVFFHELGHFLVARFFGIRVLTFSIGFGPELVGFNDRHGTRWKISAIPLGGYVKFFGDENAASVPDQAAIARMTDDEARVSFVHQGVGARAAVVAAGPIANFILAVAIFAGVVIVAGKQVTTPRIDGVKSDSLAAQAGFQKGDTIVAIDGSQIESFSDVERVVAMNSGRPLTFTVQRGAGQVTLQATPEQRGERDRFGNVHRIGRLDINGPVIKARVGSVQPGSAAAAAGLEVGDAIESIGGTAVESFTELRDVVHAHPAEPLPVKIKRGARSISLTVTPAVQIEKSPDGTSKRVGLLGISGTFDPDDVKVVRYGPISAVTIGVEETWNIVRTTLTYIGRIFAGREAADQVGGPIMIAQVSGQMATLGWAAFLNFVAVLSVSIGLLNLFPVPLLDGGHLLFYAVEVLRGRPLSDRAQEVGFRIGFVLVVALMIFAAKNDIYRLWNLAAS